MACENTTRFLNVDLDLRGKRDLTELVAAFAPEASALHCGPIEGGYFANLELDMQPASAEAAIRTFVALVEKLPPRERSLWNETSTRDFSIGVEAGEMASSFELALTPDALRLAADVEARVVFVVYVHGSAGKRSK